MVDSIDVHDGTIFLFFKLAMDKKMEIAVKGRGPIYLPCNMFLPWRKVMSSQWLAHRYTPEQKSLVSMC